MIEEIRCDGKRVHPREFPTGLELEGYPFFICIDCGKFYNPHFEQKQEDNELQIKKEREKLRELEKTLRASEVTINNLGENAIKAYGILLKEIKTNPQY